MFKQRNNGDFRYQDKPEGSVIEVDVYSHKGGTNLLTYKREQKGIYISFHRVKIENAGNGLQIRSFELFGSGVKFCVLPLDRLNPKKLAKVAEYFTPHVAQLAEQWGNDPNAANERIAQLCREYRGEAVAAAQ